VRVRRKKPAPGAAGEPLTEIGARVRAYLGGGGDTVTAARAGALAQNVHANRYEGRADDALVAAEAERWVAARHPMPAFGATVLDQVRTLLGGAS
jgi:hypothetical protein